METAGSQTAETVDNYLRRRMVWDLLLHEFRVNRPDDKTLGLVGTLASLALENVAGAQGRDLDSEPAPAFQRDKDHAECAALYGYVMGFSQAMKLATAGIPTHGTSGD